MRVKYWKMKQHAALGQGLYNLVLKGFIRNSRIKRNGNIYHQTFQVYVNDVVVIARIKKNLKRYRLKLRGEHD